jgi:hypothetical protein
LCEDIGWQREAVQGMEITRGAKDADKMLGEKKARQKALERHREGTGEKTLYKSTA